MFQHNALSSYALTCALLIGELRGSPDSRVPAKQARCPKVAPSNTCLAAKWIWKEFYFVFTQCQDVFTHLHSKWKEFYSIFTNLHSMSRCSIWKEFYPEGGARISSSRVMQIAARCTLEDGVSPPWKPAECPPPHEVVAVQRLVLSRSSSWSAGIRMTGRPSTLLIAACLEHFSWWMSACAPSKTGARPSCRCIKARLFVCLGRRFVYLRCIQDETERVHARRQSGRGSERVDRAGDTVGHARVFAAGSGLDRHRSGWSWWLAPGRERGLRGLGSRPSAIPAREWPIRNHCCNCFASMSRRAWGFAMKLLAYINCS